MKPVNPYTKFFTEDLTPVDGDLGNAFWAYHVSNNFGRLLGIDGTINFATAQFSTNLGGTQEMRVYDVPIGQLGLTNPPVIVAYATQHGTSGGMTTWPVCLEAYADFEKVRFKWMSESRGDVYFKIFGNAETEQNAGTVERNGLLPETGDILTIDWAQRVAQQQLRALGFWGSSIHALTFDQSDCLSATTATISLPAVYGTTVPPMIFAVVRFGSVAIYKSFMDRANLIGRYVGGGTQSWEPVFHTYIRDLVNTDGVWSFRIVHRSNLNSRIPSFSVMNFRAPYRPIGSYQWRLPSEYSAETENRLAIHWHALGVDTSIGA